MSAEQRLKAQVWRDEAVEEIRMATEQWVSSQRPFAYPKWRKMRYQYVDPASCGEWIHFLVLNNREQEAERYRKQALETARSGPQDKLLQEQRQMERIANLVHMPQPQLQSEPEPEPQATTRRDTPSWWTSEHEELHQKMFGSDDNDDEDAEEQEVIEIIEAVAVVVDVNDGDAEERAERRRVREQLDRQQASDAAFALELQQQGRRVRQKPLRVDPQFGKANVAVKYRKW